MQSIGALALQVFGFFIVPAIFTLSLVAFVFAAAKYLIEGDHKEEEKEKAKLYMAYAIVMFWVMALMWVGASYLFGSVLSGV
jgi:hypothetical protein